MKLTVKLENGYLMPYSKEDKQKLNEIKDGIYQTDIKNSDMRTITQNRALHKYFTILADELNKGGLTVTKVLKADIEWSPESIKEQLWRPIQKALLGKDSTTKLSKDEVSKVYDTLNLALGNKFGLSVDFPSQD